ncbi:hypothetical protein JK358_29605 [Nocardia sp. 2]|uniref:DUF8020 domain-containing protein n=1 Tax=Nocardia acididurans TaxID=2802282 RepID=A0ABS1MET1_9NOCA|nr:hypothetical protein [Nocardia acididurans]
MTLATAPASAEPAPQPDLVYSTKLVDKAVVTTLKGGTFDLSEAPAADAADIVHVKDALGNVLLTLPLKFTIGTVAVPVQPTLDKDATVLTLTPQRPDNLPTEPLRVQPVASKSENQQALTYFSTQFGLATTIGTFIGTAIGATVGCLATLVAGCIAGFTAGAAIGGILGSIAVGGPTLIVAGIDLLTTMNAADGTSKWAEQPTQATQTTPAQPTAPQPAN